MNLWKEFGKQMWMDKLATKEEVYNKIKEINKELKTNPVANKM